MFSFHWPELIIIVALAAILFPKRLPQIGDALGKGIRGFRRTVHEIDEQSGLGEIKEIGRREAADLRDRVTIDVKPSSAASAPGSAGGTPPEEHRSS